MLQLIGQLKKIVSAGNKLIELHKDRKTLLEEFDPEVRYTVMKKYGADY